MPAKTKTKEVKKKAPNKPPKKRNNPPIKQREFDPAEVADTLRKNMGLVMRSARVLGCSRDTVRRYIINFPECATARDDGRELLKDEAEVGLHGAIRKGEAWAICFTLKTIGQDRGFVEKQVLDHTSSDGTMTPPTAVQFIPYDSTDTDNP